MDQSMDNTVKGVSKGAYPVVDCENPELIFLATGSEVGLAMEVAESMNEKKIRVVSMPCWELFDQQDQQYRDQVLPPGVVARIAVEAGIRQGWDAYLGESGRFVGMTGFGASAPASVLYEHFGITAENVAGQARELVGR